MGVDKERFVQTVDPNLLCGVCGGVLQEAVLTPCGHSFCSLCLHTWLARPAARTCPECRARVTPHCLKPVHSLRNLVLGLHVRCEHSARGCHTVLTLEQLPLHVSSCPFAPVQCAGCGEHVNRLDLADHQMACPGIAASLKDEQGERDEGEGIRGGEDGADERGQDESEIRLEAAWRQFRERLRTAKTVSGGDVAILLGRIRALEERVERLLEDVRTARGKNAALERQYETISGQLRHKHSELRQLQDTEFFLEHECARTPETVARLSLLIARHLLQKPRYVDAGKAFSAVRRCYDKFHRDRPECRHDVHMLLATAYASNWFSPCHRLSFHCWLQTVSRPAARSATSLFNS